MVVVVVAQDVLASALRHAHHCMALASDERVQVRQQALRALVETTLEMCGKCERCDEKCGKRGCGKVEVLQSVKSASSRDCLVAQGLPGAQQVPKGIICSDAAR